VIDADQNDFNMWRGFEITREQAESYVSSLGDAADVQVVLDHIKMIWCQGKDVLYQYCIRWLAWVIQRPECKLGVALVLQGAQGGGKGIVVALMRRIIGERHSTQIMNMQELTGKFTGSALKACCLCFVDEATWGGNKQEAGAIKKLISERHHKVEDKFKDPYYTQSFTNYIWASNEIHVCRNQ